MRKFVLAFVFGIVWSWNASAAWEIRSMKGATEQDRAIATRAVGIVNATVSSSCFGERVKAAKFTETNKKSNDEILTLVRKGYPLDLIMYRSLKPWSKVYAYVADVNGPIYLHRKFWRPGYDRGRANTLVHEYMHKLWFSHQFSPWSSSVPYQVGNILEECAAGVPVLP